jgi:uncharacterized protein (DUF1810 family)
VNDPFELQRFVDAQDAGGVYLRAVTELRAGRKTSHWMWFVFPQIAGLGRSPTAQHFAISGMPEARAFGVHPVLGPRLVECARILTTLPGRDAVAVFGPVDAQKLCSSMTLFAQAVPHEPVFQAVLDQYFGGESDPATTSRVTEPISWVPADRYRHELAELNDTKGAQT